MWAQLDFTSIHVLTKDLFGSNFLDTTKSSLKKKSFDPRYVVDQYYLFYLHILVDQNNACPINCVGPEILWDKKVYFTIFLFRRTQACPTDRHRSTFIQDLSDLYFTHTYLIKQTLINLLFICRINHQVTSGEFFLK